MSCFGWDDTAAVGYWLNVDTCTDCALTTGVKKCNPSNGYALVCLDYNVTTALGYYLTGDTCTDCTD